MTRNVVLAGVFAAYLMSTCLAMADTVWRGADLWLAPAPTASIRQINVNQNAELIRTCSEFQKSNEDFSEFPIEERKNVFDSVRRQALKSAWPELKFSAIFKTDIPSNGNILTDKLKEELSVAIASASKGNTAPIELFIQMPESLIIQDLSMLKINQLQESGFLKIGKELGLLPLPVSVVVKHGDGVYLLVTGKDTACDILKGNARLSAIANVSSTITLSEQIKFKNLFANISKMTRKATKSYKNSNQRAAMLGFHFGSYLQSNFKDYPVESYDETIRLLVGSLFDKDMNLNKLWDNSSGESVVRFQPYSDDFQVSIDFNSISQFK